MSNVGQALLDIVGLAASIYTGNPLWFALSAAAGGILFPSRLPIQGPTLSDLKTTSVTIGAPLVIPYGTIAVPGNVIYLGLLQTQSQSSGKGGSGPTTYTYFQTIGIAPCAGNASGADGIIGVQRIWENGKLVYDTRPQQLGESATVYSARLTANATYAATFVLYLGSSTQGVDPTMETEQGSGNVPAFRGLAYIVYPNRQLQDSQGLRHPQSWKFEVIAGGSLENEAIAPTFLSGAYDDTLQVDIIAMDANNGRYYIFNADNDGNGAVLGFNISDNTQFVQRLGSDMGVGIAAGLGGNFLAICPDGGVIFTNYDAGDTLVWRKLDPLTLATDSELTADDAFDFPTWYATGSTTDYTGQVDSIMCSNSLVESSIMRLRSVVILGAPLEIDYSSPSYGGMRVVAGGDELGAIRFYVAGFGAGGIDIYKVLWQPGTDPLLNPNPSVSSTLIGNVPISSFAPGATGYSQFAGLIYDPNGALITTVNVTAATTPGAYMLSIDTTDANVTWTEEVAGVFAYDYDLGTSRIANGVMYVAGAGSQNVYGVDSGSGAISTVSLAGSGGLSGGIELLGAFVYDGPTGTMVSWTSAGPYVIFINKPVAGTPYIGDIIADISARVGVAPDQIDVSDFQAGTALPSYRTTVLGYALGRQMAARDAIQPLMQVGMFDAIASVVPSTNAPVYRFQARGKPIAHTLSADDLGAYQFGAQAAVEWTSKRALDTDLPRFIRVHYLAPSRDYDNAEQISPSRTTSSTVNDVSIELGVALTDDQAAKVATITWQDMWATRQSYEIATDGSLGYLEAADPVQVPLLERNEPMLLKSLTSSAQSLIKLELVSYSEDAYTSNAVASPPVGPGSSIFYAADSSLFLIDSPLLRDQDDTDRESDPLYTAATAANGGVWDGANIYESDDGATYAQVAQAPNAASFGTATTVLSASASPFVTDTVNTVTVQMAAGSQAPSGTTTSDLLDGANPAVIIDATGSLEVFQFRDVAVNSDETVTLSYLLRGRRGTDQMTGAHQVGSAVVFLSPTTLEIIDLPLSDIGIQLYWKAIASGASLASASPRTFAAIGRSLMPYAPWNPSAAIYSTGDIAINADRRARIGAAEWIDRETDNLPLAEDSSLFECDIISGGAVLRTLREVQLPIVYAAADVATDFGSAPAQLTVALYQISQQVDRGFAMRATLPVILTAGSPPATSPSWIAPGQPGTPSLSVSTDISVAWTAAAPGTYPIANYRLQRSLSGAGGFATIATQPGLTYDDGTLSPATEYFYREAAVDSMGNPGPYSSTASGTTPGAGGGGGGGGGGSSIKWNPGNYAQSDFYLDPSDLTATFADIDRMAAVVDGSGNPMLLGYMLQFYPGDADVGTSGYERSAAFVTAINAVRSRLQTDYSYHGSVHPFRLMIRAGPLSPSGTGRLPPWAVNGVSGVSNSGGSGNTGDATPSSSAGAGGYTIDLWRAGDMANWAAMWADYGSLWDSDPYFEAVNWLREMSQQYDSPPNDYSASAWDTQFKAALATIQAAWPTTNLSPGPNFGPSGTSQSYINSSMAYLFTKPWAMGGPDVITAASGIGETWGELQQYGGPGSDGTDYTGLDACIMGVEDDVYLWTSQDSVGDEAYAFGTLKNTHTCWTIFPQATYEPLGLGNSGQWWETGTVPALAAVGYRIGSTAYPQNYP